MLSISSESKSQIIKSTFMIAVSAGVITAAALVMAFVLPKLQAVVTNLEQTIRHSKHLYEWKSTLVQLVNLAKLVPNTILGASIIAVVIFKIVAVYHGYKITKAVTQLPPKPDATNLPMPTFTVVK